MCVGVSGCSVLAKGEGKQLPSGESAGGERGFPPKLANLEPRVLSSQVKTRLCQSPALGAAPQLSSLLSPPPSTSCSAFSTFTPGTDRYRLGHGLVTGTDRGRGWLRL